MSPHPAYRGDPLVSSSRPYGGARPKTKKTESRNRRAGEQEQEARSRRPGDQRQEAKRRRAGGESPAPRARSKKDRPMCRLGHLIGWLAMRGQEEEDKAAGAASRRQDSVDELLEDSLEEEEIQAIDQVDGEAGGVDWGLVRESGGVDPLATSKDSQKDTPCREAQEEEDPVKEK